MIKIAPIFYGMMQMFLLYVYNFIDDNLFNTQQLGTYYLIGIIFLTCTFYCFTAYKDPGFVTINDYQYTDCSNPYQKKRPSFNPLHASQHMREQLPEEQIEVKVENAKKIQKNKDEFEIECEQSVDDQNIEDIQHNFDNVKSQQKTPEKSRIHSKVASITHSPHNVNVRSSQVISQGSTKPDFLSQQNSNHPASVINEAHQEQHEINIEQVIEQQNSPKSNEKQIDQSVNHANSMFIEKRYCPVCNQDQIIRSRHCRKCKRCVALYDHHCPWTSNCVGERNRCVFYWFLVFQLQEMIYVIYETFPLIELTKYSSWYIFLIVSAILLTIFMTLMVVSLFMFHSLLTFKNMTTWEYKSWKRISYLKDFPQALGSPFSQGWKQNVRQYCRFSVPKLTNWEYNTHIVNFIK